MENLSVLIAKRIKEIRKEKGLRQEDMEGFGFNYRYYQKIESGKANITLNTIERIAKAFEIKPSEFFTLPLDSSNETDELTSLINQLIKKKDRKSIRKITVFIKEIL